MCNLNYVRIPRYIIYNTSLGDKRVILFSYICSRRSLDDTVAFSVTELCEWSKLKPNYRDGKINQKYLNILNLFSQMNYFREYPNFQQLLAEKKNSTDFYKLKLNIDKFDCLDSFAIIYFDELQKILNFKEELKDSGVDLSRMSSAYILLLLSYIRVNMNYSTDKPMCCYRLYQTISNDIGLSERYISRIIDILDELNIIRYKEGKRKRYQKKNGTYGYLTAPKIFADYRHISKDEFGKPVEDRNYSYANEIQKQMEILSSDSS